eukprot:5081479-Lingulodinium_polyedra.AAC.1
MAHLAPDEMHTLFLGVFQNYILAVFWQVLLADAYGLGAGLPEAVRLHRGADRLGVDLANWYQKQRSDNPNAPLYELS